MLFFGGFTPYRYRLEGPNPWKGARQAIMTQMERYRSQPSIHLAHCSLSLVQNPTSTEEARQRRCNSTIKIHRFLDTTVHARHAALDFTSHLSSFLLISPTTKNNQCLFFPTQSLVLRTCLFVALTYARLTRAHQFVFPDQTEAHRLEGVRLADLCHYASQIIRSWKSMIG